MLKLAHTCTLLWYSTNNQVLFGGFSMNMIVLVNKNCKETLDMHTSTHIFFFTWTIDAMLINLFVSHTQKQQNPFFLPYERIDLIRKYVCNWIDFGTYRVLYFHKILNPALFDLRWQQIRKKSKRKWLSAYNNQARLVTKWLSDFVCTFFFFCIY